MGLNRRQLHQMKRMDAGFLVGQTIAVVPITLAEAKTWLRRTDSDDDTAITMLLGAACEQVQRATGRTILGQTWTMRMDHFPAGELGGGWWDGVREGAESYTYARWLEIPTTPVSVVNWVKTYDLDNTATTFASSNYTVDLGDKDQFARIILNVGAVWPSALRPFMAIEVNVDAGYTTQVAPTVFFLPQGLKICILKVLSWMYNNRGECDPLQAEDTVAMMPSVQQWKLGHL